MLTKEQIDGAIQFHGHICPGLAIGLRAAEYVIENFFDPEKDEGLMTVTETNMCAVDALQFLLGSTFGKGNLVLLDHGKKAFSFFRVDNDNSIRCICREGGMERHGAEIRKYREQMANQTIDEAGKKRHGELMKIIYDEIMKADFNDIFSVSETQVDLPKKARIFETIVCDECSEGVMESRIRKYTGKNLCIPCFNKHDAIRVK